MKHLLKRISVLLLALTLTMGFDFSVLAADSEVTYEGGAEAFVFLSGSEYTDTDLFDNFKNVMPGDNLSEIITVKNDFEGCDYIKIYMRAVTHDETDNPLIYDEEFENTDGKDQAGIDGMRDETVASMEDFLAQLSMTVKQGDKVLFRASPDQLGGLKENVLLAKLEYGASTELTVELSVPIEMGNECANRVGEADWIFVAEEHNYPSKPEEPKEPDEPEVYPYVPVITAPKTGDNSNAVLWMVVLAAAAVTAVCIVKKRRRK